MKETRFIAQNKEKWSESENLLKDRVKDPEKLSTLFTQVIDDLSYSRTFYPNRSVRVYLNKIGREYFSIIYNRQGQQKNHFIQFWTDELPQVVIHCRKQILISLIIFVLSACIGIFSAVNDPEFTSSILGESYVTMTKENIEKGDPMAVYKKGHQVDMFLGITLNNLMVAFRTYVMGVFLSIGTVAILLYNGIMVGCFQYFFIERGLFAESALTIWLHGTLEISSIILAGGAGLTLGSGLIFPGTYSRLQAFQISAIRSLKLMLGIAPIFVVAGIIESFLTRYTDVPDVIRIFLILLSAGFIIGYFGVYPWLKSKKGFAQPLQEVRLPPTIIETPKLDRIKNNAELIKDGFLFYKKYGGKLLPWIFFLSLLATAADVMLSGDRSTEVYTQLWWISLFNDLYYAIKTPAPEYILVNSLSTGIITYIVYRMIKRENASVPSNNVAAGALFQIILITAALYGIIHWLETFGMLIAGVTFIGIFLIGFVIKIEENHLFNGISRAWELASENSGQVFGLQIILILLSFSFLMMLSAPLLYMNIQVLEWHFAQSDEWARNIISFVEKFIRIFALNLTIPLLAACSAYLYYSLQEVSTAHFLKKSIAMVGSKLTKNRRS